MVVPLSFEAAKEFGALLREATKARDIVGGRLLHAKLKELRLDGATFLGNLVVNLYGSCGSIEESQRAFEAIQHRNVFSWNILLSALYQNGDLREAQERFERMPAHNNVSWNAMAAAATSADEAREIFARMPEKNTVSWNAILGLRARSGDVAGAKRVFDEMHERDAVSWNALVAAYAQELEQRSLHEALLVFNRLPQLGIVAWNSMIAVHARSGRCDEAIAIFLAMPARDLVSWNSIVTGLMQCARIADGKQLFQRMPLQDLVSWNAIGMADVQAGNLDDARSMYEERSCRILGTALISAYAAANRIRDAREIFDAMPEHDVISWTSIIAAYAANHELQDARLLFDRIPQRDTVCWTSMIAGYAQAGDLDQSKRLFLEAPQRDSVSYNAMIHAFVLGGDLDQARGFFDQICEHEQHNTGSWNTIIAGCVQHGHWSEALLLFRKMDLEGIPADSITLISSLDACSSLAALDLGKIIAAEASADDRFARDVGVSTQIIDMFAKCGKLQSARRVFDKMGGKNLLTWNTMIAAYAQNSRSQGHGHNPGVCTDTAHVLGLLLAMAGEGFEPSDVTMLSVISACGHAGLLAQSHHYFVSTISDFGLDMKIDHYQCVIDLFSRVGELELAEDLIQALPFEPDLTTWKTMLSACRVHGDAPRAVKIAAQILELDPDDGSSYNLLANTYTSNLEYNWI